MPSAASFSMIAYPRLLSAPDTDTPSLPQRPVGSPGFLVISIHESPPSVDLKRPLPGPPLDMLHGVRCASHRAAKMTFGFFGSIERSTPPVFSSLNSVRRQVLPPSLDLKMPRCGCGL